MSISLFFLNRMVNPYGKFSEPGFPHNFAKNDRQDLKMGYAVRMRLDTSYNLCSKLGSKLVFLLNYGSFSFAIKVPDHFPILTAISRL